MQHDPLAPIQNTDHTLFDHITASRELAFGEGVLPLKQKLLIALALDASHGAVNGVKALAMQALTAGATREEIMETLRIVNFVSGVGSVYTAAYGLQDVL